MKTNRLRDAIALALISSTAVIFAPAFAQDAGSSQTDGTKTLDRIEVTGSRILRTDSETASPVQVITHQEIERTGKLTIGDYLQTLTAAGQGSLPKSFGAGFASGSSGISLRGLGAGSTLVLINGRRLAPYGLADDGQKVFADLGVIPAEAVERVEVLKDGASALYGSDAIAGVVNIILRKDFNGTVLKGTYGRSEYGDGVVRKGSFMTGYGDLDKDGYNLYLGVEASKTGDFKNSERTGKRKWIGDGDIRRYGYDYRVAAFPGLAGNVASSGAAGNAPNGAIRNADGVTYTQLEGCEQFTNVSPPDPNGGCLWQTGKFIDLAPSQQYANVFLHGTFVLSPNAEAYADFIYSKKKSVYTNTPSSVTSSWGYPGGAVVTGSGPDQLTIDAAHPDNTTGQTNRFRYSAWDVGPRETQLDSSFMRLVGGVKGSAGEWDYDVGYLHSQSNVDSARTGFLRNSRVRTVLNDPNSPVGWWRIGADAGLNSQALYDYISPTIYAHGATKLDSIDASFSRSLADLSGGPLGLALGAEYRRLSVSLAPGTYTDIGDVIGLGYSAYSGTEQVASAYAEINAPITKTVELNGALRVDSYKGGDNAVTPKFGIKWKPTDWLALRGTYGEGFRAPNAAETGGQLAAFSTNDYDPVRCPGGKALPNATPVPTCGAAGISLISTGSKDLQPEKSKTYTAGLVFSPTPNTSITLDAWQIKRRNEINTESIPSAIDSGNFIRDDQNLTVNGVVVPNSGNLLAVFTRFVNSSSTTVRGVDFDARQSFDIGAESKLALDLQWSHISKFERVDGADKSEFAGTHGNCDVSNCIGTPKDHINFGTTWDINKAFGLGAVVNYRSSMKNVLQEGGDCAYAYADGSPAPHGCRVPSFYTIDLSGTWTPTDAWEVAANIDNVTNRIAPLDPVTYGALNYNPVDFSGAVGRYYTLTVKYSFK